ncbi:hypothetical protein SEVCU139_0465 [Staphylococcus lugdunensis VCU139]|nr:hypothetical protein SEVCU139_0465 [Staphylococcus lugdunensis VCU139]
MIQSTMKIHKFSKGNVSPFITTFPVTKIKNIVKNSQIMKTQAILIIPLILTIEFSHNNRYILIDLQAKYYLFILYFDFHTLVNTSFLMPLIFCDSDLFYS